MAISATVVRAKISIADMSRHYYQNHSLTLAQHPSETETRLMIRLLAFALHAHEDLQFTKGLSAEDEPEIWIKSLTDEIELWVELGLPDETRIKKACNRSKQVLLFCYDDRSFGPWYKKNESKLQRDNLKLFRISDADSEKLISLYSRQIDLQINIEEDEIYIGNNNNPDQHITINITAL